MQEGRCLPCNCQLLHPPGLLLSAGATTRLGGLKAMIKFFSIKHFTVIVFHEVTSLSSFYIRKAALVLV